MASFFYHQTSFSNIDVVLYLSCNFSFQIKFFKLSIPKFSLWTLKTIWSENLKLVWKNPKSKLNFVQIMIPKRTVRTRLVIKFLHSHNGGGLFRMVTVSFFYFRRKKPRWISVSEFNLLVIRVFHSVWIGIFKLYEDLKTSNYMYYIILYWTLYLKQSILYYVPALHKAKILLLIKNDIFTVYEYSFY